MTRFLPAPRVVWLGAKHRSGFINAFEDSDHDLFVELGRLGQVRRSTEMVDGEDVGPGLRRAGDELGPPGSKQRKNNEGLSRRQPRDIAGYRVGVVTHEEYRLFIPHMISVEMA
jgi:hypothetical protein